MEQGQWYELTTTKNFKTEKENSEILIEILIEGFEKGVMFWVINSNLNIKFSVYIENNVMIVNGFYNSGLFYGYSKEVFEGFVYCFYFHMYDVKIHENGLLIEEGSVR